MIYLVKKCMVFAILQSWNLEIFKLGSQWDQELKVKILLCLRAEYYKICDIRCRTNTWAAEQFCSNVGEKIAKVTEFYLFTLCAFSLPLSLNNETMHTYWSIYLTSSIMRKVTKKAHGDNSYIYIFFFFSK